MRTQAEAASRVQDAFWHCARRLITFHTTPWELDEALQLWGYDMGPCEAMDLVGLEKVLARRPDTGSDIPILHRMVLEGRIGKAGSVGFYRYPGGGGAVIDPLIEDLIIEEVRFAGQTRSELGAEPLVSQMNDALRAALSGLERDMVRVATRAVHFPDAKADFLVKP